MPNRVPIKDIFIDPDVQPRMRLDEERVALLAALYGEGQLLPPVTIIKTREGRLILADGFTRVAAAVRSELESIPAAIRVGSKRDAVAASIELNAIHGAPLTLPERRRSAERMLADPEWCRESDRELGRRCGLDNKTIAKIRAETAPATVDNKRKVRRKGRAYELNVPPARALPQVMQKRSALNATTSEENPQMTEEPAGQYPAPVLAKPLNLSTEPAAPKRDQRRLRQLSGLAHQWELVSEQLAVFRDLLNAAEPLVRERFLKDKPAAVAILSIFRSALGHSAHSGEPSEFAGAEE